MYFVQYILIDEQGKTVGGRVTDKNTGKVYNFRREDLRKIANFENAIVDRNGYLRSKQGYKKLGHKVYTTNCKVNERPNAIEQQERSIAKRLIEKEPLILYHGNKDASMIPQYGAGKKDTDYGQGFYLTPDKSLAKEWAWSGYEKGNKGFVHTYELKNINSLNVLDFTELDSIHWIAELISHRNINLSENKNYEIVLDNIEKLKAKYKLDTSNVDVIVGYRADDSYFQYAKDFVSALISKEALDRALRLGNLGLQVFIKSQKAFDNLKIVTKPEEVDRKYEGAFIKRDKSAKEAYTKVKTQGKQDNKRTSIFDYLR